MPNSDQSARSRALDDALYAELIPCRITRAGSHPDGPTAAFAEYDNERQKWAAIHEVTRTVEAERRSA